MKKYGEHVKVWKKNFGEIPKDKNGRSYEIHHIDGDASNNDITNLMCVSIDEHYEIHKAQKEYTAAFLIARRMDIKPDDIAELARKGTMKRILEGTHNFLDSNFKRSLYHNTGYVVAKDVRTGKMIRIKKEDFDTNDFYVGANDGKKHKNPHKNRGHNKGKKWKQKNKRKNIVMCPHCNKTGDASGLKRWHFDNCKEKII